MSVALLLELGLKSILVAGLALALLHLLRGRSAAERSLVGHAGIAAILALPLLAVAGPRWPVETPGAAAWIEPIVPQPEALSAPVPSLAEAAGPAAAVAPPPGWPGAEILPLIVYAVPAALLALLTLVAVLRLVAIRRRAAVLTEPHWLAALAHAQRRMGFKNGAALLSSGELGSPVSWGLFRPTIVLDPLAVRSPADAEAIIAHELAHVVRRDWLKLLAARAATALFWFNPLVWLLARQCHQLREEAADDAVLRSEVANLAYAELLVGAARHESRGALLAANGVAPGRDSLKRRVARVLDKSLSRRAGGLGWRAGSALAAITVAAPLAAVTPAAQVAAAATERTLLAGHSEGGAAAIAVPLDPGADAALERAIEARVESRIEMAAEAEADRAVAAAGTATLETAVAADPVRQLALRPFSQIEVNRGAQVVLRPGSGFSARARAGRLDPSRFHLAGGRLTILPCTTDCAAGPIEIVMPRVEAVAVRGGGSIVAEPGFPRAASVAAAVHSGGTLDLRAVPVDDAVAAVSAGGEILIRPTRSLMGAVDAGGEIVYWGDPTVSSAAGAGGVIRRGGGT